MAYINRLLTCDYYVMALLEKLVYAVKLPFIGRAATVLIRVLGVNIPPSVEIGEGLVLPHGAVGLVVHERARIGARAKLYQGVTLGRSDTHLEASLIKSGGSIEIGDDVIIGANSTVLFRSGETLTIGDNAVIGANSVVLRSVPPGEIWAGNPARRVSTRK
ncbi:serine O-acetyltransferase [Arthrobacter sp. NPDC058097]|uniref:serine O-acetyltransferase n=1 Tax=Arthrobacter sp. NPDC058097 TaxID=3346340 RepID=UPI0036DCC356